MCFLKKKTRGLYNLFAQLMLWTPGNFALNVLRGLSILTTYCKYFYCAVGLPSVTTSSVYKNNTIYRQWPCYKDDEGCVTANIFWHALSSLKTQVAIPRILSAHQVPPSAFALGHRRGGVSTSGHTSFHSTAQAGKNALRSCWVRHYIAGKIWTRTRNLFPNNYEISTAINVWLQLLCYRDFLPCHPFTVFICSVDISRLRWISRVRRCVWRAMDAR